MATNYACCLLQESWGSKVVSCLLGKCLYPLSHIPSPASCYLLLTSTLMGFYIYGNSEFWPDSIKVQAVLRSHSVGSVHWSIARWKFYAEHHSVSFRYFVLNFIFILHVLHESVRSPGTGIRDSWELGIEPGSSQRTASVPNCGAISPTLVRILFLNPGMLTSLWQLKTPFAFADSEPEG